MLRLGLAAVGANTAIDSQETSAHVLSALSLQRPQISDVTSWVAPLLPLTAGGR